MYSSVPMPSPNYVSPFSNSPQAEIFYRDLNHRIKESSQQQCQTHYYSSFSPMLATGPAISNSGYSSGGFVPSTTIKYSSNGSYYSSANSSMPR